MQRWHFVAMAMLLTLTAPLPAADRETKVREDRQRIEADGYWLYGDFAKGVAEAKQSRRPLAIALRCIPCEECVKLDEELMHADPTLRKLLDQFVRVRIVSTNGLDLSIFQFDTDQSFAMFFLNADGTIYGRYGTRSHREEWADDVSLPGLARALEGALALHRDYPRNRQSLAGKRGPKPEIATPDKFPVFKGRYGPTLSDKQGQLVASCIHCHQIGDAQRQAYLDRREVLPDQVLFPYPHPKATGLILDPEQRATVLSVTDDSPASLSGFQPGDELLALAGQPLISIADVQWVLHHADADGAEIPVQAQRKGKAVSLTLKLPRKWRERDTISWRASSWQLRKTASGGLLLGELTAEERQEQGLPADGMALFVRHVGQYSPHDAAKKAGVLKGDVVVGFDGRTDLLRETDLLAHSLRQHKPGDVVEVLLLRNGKQQSVKLTLQ